MLFKLHVFAFGLQFNNGGRALKCDIAQYLYIYVFLDEAKACSARKKTCQDKVDGDIVALHRKKPWMPSGTAFLGQLNVSHA